MEMNDKRPRMGGLRDDAREVAETTPGVDAADGDDQMLLSESSTEEQTPLGELVDEPAVTIEELQRMKAELENSRKRMKREQTRSVAYATEVLMRKMLPVVDHFQLAVDHDEAGDGVKLALKELMEVLSSEGLEEIDAPAGTPFDPTVHHALATQPDPDVTEDTVTQVHRRGYRFKERVLRAPEVVVAQPINDAAQA